MFDKFHDECGVFAIYGHPEAANLAYLGLYALQHRGQESAGIASSDGRDVHCREAMGHVADIFTPEVLGTLPGELAIGHTRYSTAGDTVLLNAQPFSVACNKGRIAVAHNGNITNAAELRRELEREGSIFQAYSDTEVILHLVARSRERTLAGALREALLQLEGAFSLVFLAEDRIIVARDPHGFRPLAFGQMELSGRPHLLRVRVGNLRVRPDQRGLSERRGAGRDGDRRAGGHDARALCAGARRTRTACSSTSIFRGRIRLSSDARCRNRARSWDGCWRAKHPVDADVVVPVPDSGVAAAIGYASESGIPFRQALIRNHYVGRTFIEPSQAIRDFGVKLKLNPVRHLLEGKRVILVDDSMVRGTTSARSSAWCAARARAKCTCAFPVRRRFRRASTAWIRPAWRELIAANNTVEEIRRFVEADSLGYLSLGCAARSRRGRRTTITATPATPATIRPSWSISKS